MDREMRPEEALASARAMRRRVAERAATPAYYGPLYGLGCAGLVAGAALPQPLGIIVVAISLLGVTALYRFWQDRTGLSVNGYRQGRTRTIALALAAALVSLIALGLVLRTAYGLAWAPFACGAIAFAVAWAGNQAWDRAWRAQMRAPV